MMPRGFANANIGLDEAKTSPLWKSEWGKNLGERAHVFETEEPLFTGPRLAPMFQDKEYGHINEKAKKRILDEDSRAQASDAFTVARDELRRASPTYHHDVREMMHGIVSNPVEYHKKFMRPYKDIINDMDTEAEKLWVEKHLPRLEGRAIMSGTLNSPQQIASQKRFMQDYLSQLNRDKKKLKLDASERAWNTATSWLGQTHGYLGTAAQMAEQDRESHIKRAQAQMGLESEKTKQESARADILRAQADREQAQRQKEYENAYIRHQEPIERRKRNLEREAAVFSNMPQTGENVRQYLPSNPTPISPASVGAAGLFTMADLMRGKPHKKGGRALSLIDQKFKKGGKVAHLAEGGNPYQMSDKEIGFNSPELELIREQSRKTHKEDPTSGFLSTMAGNLWKNLRNPATGFGEGMLKGTDAYHAANERNRVNEHRQMALLKGIEDSRQKQKNLLAEYEQQKLTREENIRHHMASEAMSKAQLGESSRHHGEIEKYSKVKADAAMQGALAKSELKSSKRYLYDLEGKPYAERTSEASKHINELIDGITDAAKSLKYMGEAARESAKIDSGPWKEKFSNDESVWNKALPIGKTLIQGTSKDLDEIAAARRAQEKYVSQASNTSKTRTNMGLRQIQAGKLGVGLSRENNINAYKNDAGYDIEALESALEKLKLSGASVEERQYAEKVIKDLKEDYNRNLKEFSGFLGAQSEKKEQKVPSQTEIDAENARMQAELANGG